MDEVDRESDLCQSWYRPDPTITLEFQLWTRSLRHLSRDFYTLMTSYVYKEFDLSKGSLISKLLDGNMVCKDKIIVSIFWFVHVPKLTA